MTKVDILQRCIVEGLIVKLPEVQLDRNLYLEVAKTLQLIGGKWKGGKTQGFVFESDPTKLLEEIASGKNVNLKKEYQFYATPDDLADELVALADIEKNSTILEPSAGQGAIVKAIHRKFPERTVCGYELMEINQSFLSKIENFELIGSDFLTECKCMFDVIIANPPFAKNQDIDHVKHMYECLKPGGHLVSIMSPHWSFAEDKKSQRFREWIEDVDAEIVEIDRGRFKGSGTMIGSVIVVINK